MHHAKAYLCALAMTLAACESVPDLHFEDAAAADGGDGGNDTTDASKADVSAPDTSVADTAPPDAPVCAPTNGPCKNDRDCCAGTCKGIGGGQKACSP